MYTLLVREPIWENHELVGYKPEREVIRGTETECFAKFLSLSPFSWVGNKMHSYTKYRIVKIKNYSLAPDCDTIGNKEGGE